MHEIDLLLCVKSHSKLKQQREEKTEKICKTNTHDRILLVLLVKHTYTVHFFFLLMPNFIL